MQTSVLEYRDGDTVLEGYVARPGGAARKPGLVIFPDFMGVAAQVKSRAEQLASLGYVALAADVFGKGVRPETREEAAHLAATYRNDRALLRARTRAALATLRSQPDVTPSRVAAIGYCFGGTAALELARSGADLAGVVTFHGGLETSMPAQRGAMRARILVLHGADDPFVPEAQVKAFEDEMRAAGADWQLVKYSGAVHGFSNPGAGSEPSKGFAYHARTDQRSWTAMRVFLDELFGSASAAG